MQSELVYNNTCSWLLVQTISIHSAWLIISSMKELPYSGKVWQGESLADLVNRQRFTIPKPSKLVVIIITLWLYLSIRQTFPHQILRKSKFTKVSPCQTFPLYGTCTGQCWLHGEWQLFNLQPTCFLTFVAIVNLYFLFKFISLLFSLLWQTFMMRFVTNRDNTHLSEKYEEWCHVVCMGL